MCLETMIDASILPWRLVSCQYCEMEKKDGEGEERYLTHDLPMHQLRYFLDVKNKDTTHKNHIDNLPKQHIDRHPKSDISHRHNPR